MSARGGGSAAEDEPQDAVSTRAAGQQTAEYSDDFESDEDAVLNSTVEELPGSNSNIENTKKMVTFESSLSAEDSSQKVALLENEAADDLTLPFHEEKFQQTIMLESENIWDGKKDSEEECLENQNQGDDRKNNEERSTAEVPPHDNSESDHCKDLCMPELQKGREAITLNQEENKPIPKQRVRKIRNASSSESISIPSLDDCYKPSPQPRSLLRKSDPVEDNDLNMSEEKITSRNELSSFSAPSSLTSLNATSEKKKFTESPDPEVRARMENQDQRENISISDLKLEDNTGKSPSVIEKMMTMGYEKTRKLEKSTDNSSERKVQIVEGQIVTDTIRDVSMDDKSEHVEVKNISEDSDKKQSETKETVPQKMKASSSDRSLSSSHIKKNVKAVPSSTAVSPQHLGTLKEDKRLQKHSAEIGKADSLRAAVYQDWLEKKRVFLLELKRIKKKQAENLRNNIEKKEAIKREEAIASFEAWKAMKEREAKKLSEKKKLEELEKKRVAEQDEEKRQAAQKAFEKWKERKVEYLRELSRREKQSERIRKRKEEEFVEEKKRDSISAVEKWNEKKEEYLKQKKVEKILERRRQEMQQVKKEEKDKRAMEEYEKWLEKKERKEQLEKKQKKLKAVLVDEAPSPWSPPGKVTYSINY
ncbi:microtubule-associated protein 9 isoform X2 [Rhea pennata]|uniref:microtubule-associated protein 9 isoform X2 n=1 Tax=Rhea pennata TaxID=8795 RepID=UPI002E26B490